MANTKRKTTATTTDEAKMNAPDPKKLDECLFFKRLGFELSGEQKVFRDVIYSPDIDIVFANAPAGSGKNVVAISTSCLMVECGLYDEIIYCFSLNNGFQNTVGLLPGTIEDKEASFYEPCMQALITCGYQPQKVIRELNPEGEKNGSAFISCRSHTFMRGINISERTILIIDEAANFYLDELKKVLTRVKDGTKVIVIGHSGQNDIVAHPEYSGFETYIEHFRGKPRVAVCELTHNFRGWVSRWADELDTDEMRLQARRKKRKQEKEEREREILLDSLEASESDEEDID